VENTVTNADTVETVEAAQSVTASAKSVGGFIQQSHVSKSLQQNILKTQIKAATG
jgi:hypothetical protein